MCVVYLVSCKEISLVDLFSAAETAHNGLGLFSNILGPVLMLIFQTWNMLLHILGVLHVR